MDYNFKAQPRVTKTHLEAYIDGNIVSENLSERRPEGQIIGDIQMLSAGNGAIKAAIGASTLNSLLLSIFENHDMDFNSLK